MLQHCTVCLENTNINTVCVYVCINTVRIDRHKRWTLCYFVVIFIIISYSTCCVPGHVVVLCVCFAGLVFCMFVSSFQKPPCLCWYRFTEVLMLPAKRCKPFRPGNHPTPSNQLLRVRTCWATVSPRSGFDYKQSHLMSLRWHLFEQFRGRNRAESNRLLLQYY